MSTSRCAVLGALFLAGTSAAAAAQVADTTFWWADDARRSAYVTSHGAERAYPGVVLWALPDSLGASWDDAHGQALAAGIAALRGLVGSHSWQRNGGRPLVFILSPGRFVSHATGQDTLFIPVARVRQGAAPFLHEAAHELLAPRGPLFPFESPDSAAVEAAADRFPYWLSEGLPDVLAQMAAAASGFPEGDVFEVGGLARVDATCRARLVGHPRRAELSARLGRSGRLAALFTAERMQVAPAYYACSQSLTRRLVERIGLERTVALIPAIPDGSWVPALEAALGMPLDAFRREWLGRQGIPDDLTD